MNRFDRLKRTSLLAVALTMLIVNSASAALILYEPFKYPEGDRLGGSGTSPVGKVAPNGQTWITRSPAGAGTYNEANDTLITNGNFTYANLITTTNSRSVRFGSSVAGGATNKYTDAISLGGPVTSGSLYYSMIVRFNGAVAPGGVRHSYTAFSTESANLADAGLGLGTASGTGNIPLPAGAWLRDSGTTDFHFGSGKANSDGMGPSIPMPSWQSSAAGHPYPNQQGNTSGSGQDKATIAEDGPFFVVLKYTFNPASDGNDDTVSMWINPIASTLGDNAGEAMAGAAGGSYYSAVNAFVTAALDASDLESFLLLGRGQASAAGNVNKSIDTSFDELRIGTTWADVTPVVPEPSALLLCVLGAALCGLRRFERN